MLSHCKKTGMKNILEIKHHGVIAKGSLKRLKTISSRSLQRPEIIECKRAKSRLVVIHKTIANGRLIHENIR